MSKKSISISTPAAASSRSVIDVFQQAFYFVKPAILPLLLAIVPSFYHYSNNVEKLTPQNLFRMLELNALVAVVVYVACLLFTRFQPFKAAGAAFVFLVFFNIYGLVYRYLLRLDLFRLEHYTFLPLTLMVAIYTILFLTRLRESIFVSLWKNIVLVVGVLVLFNLIHILPVELKRWQDEAQTTALANQQQEVVSFNKNSPDIYYIILDEFEGFQGIREYWHYEGVNDFANYLKDKGFFVAEASHGASKETLHEVTTRLNYREYPLGPEYLQTYIDDIAENRVMRFLKARGYTTVVFDETNLAFYSVKPIRADYTHFYMDSTISQSEVKGSWLYMDDFGQLVMNNTMYYAIADQFKFSTPTVTRHNDMINFTAAHLADRNVSSPKFVYVHLLLPHPPFMYTRDGKIEEGHFTDWNYYLDTYIYSITVARTMVDNIFKNANPENPPVIILQSDHGGRNESTVESIFLPNYPEKYKTLILNAMYLPGYDTSQLRQDINPVNTFPIVFNYLFDAKIPLVK